MTIRPQSGEVKRIVVGTFFSLGVASRDLFRIKETTLVERGRCLAQCYRVGSLKAVWSIEEGIIEFFDAEGRLLKRVNLLEEAAAQLVAA